MTERLWRMHRRALCWSALGQLELMMDVLCRLQVQQVGKWVPARAPGLELGQTNPICRERSVGGRMSTRRRALWGVLLQLVLQINVCRCATPPTPHAHLVSPFCPIVFS